MTSKTTSAAGTDRELERFPEFPPRDNMQNWTCLYQNAQAAALAVHLGNPETAMVVSEASSGPIRETRATFASRTSLCPSTRGPN